MTQWEPAVHLGVVQPSCSRMWPEPSWSGGGGWARRGHWVEGQDGMRGLRQGWQPWEWRGSDSSEGCLGEGADRI